MSRMSSERCGSSMNPTFSNTATNAACQVAERLLDAVVPVIVLSPRVVSGLGHKVHCVCKNTTFSRNPCVLQFKIEGCVC